MRSLKILIPNCLTGFRIVAFGLMIWLILSNSLRNYQIAGIIMLFALLTDLFDGFVARKIRAVTRFGYYFDHITDFLLVIVMMYVALAHLNYVLTISFIVLEIGVIIISVIKLVIKANLFRWPNIWGRASFGFAGASICVMLVLGYLHWFFIFCANLLLGISIILRLISLGVWFREVRTNA